MNLINETDLQDDPSIVGGNAMGELGSSYEFGAAAAPVNSDSVYAVGKGRSVEDVSDEDDDAEDEDEDDDLDEDDLEDDDDEDDFEDEDDDLEDDEEDEYDDEDDDEEEEDDEAEVN